ncbi:hypothetical protein WOLCODRAFT_153779 [Wolfiporia cocos MD-104 SS10]|uniref:Uncharacterized protein n=1 Tax=Wolfiporia cocos (strain MD-104) TaxID=742152 RepID=A0A2H3JNG3_WOLCO|nr:hypothetical protein WOLCODRAFT_153779 [Wolfiporia cocos MD-104 SS10]
MSLHDRLLGIPRIPNGGLATISSANATALLAAICVNHQRKEAPRDTRAARNRHRDDSFLRAWNQLPGVDERGPTPMAASDDDRSANAIVSHGCMRALEGTRTEEPG